MNRAAGLADVKEFLYCCTEAGSQVHFDELYEAYVDWTSRRPRRHKLERPAEFPQHPARFRTKLVELGHPYTPYTRIHPGIQLKAVQATTGPWYQLYLECCELAEELRQQRRARNLVRIQERIRSLQ